MTSPKRPTWSCRWSETEKTPSGAHLWMYFSSVDHTCVRLFLFSTFWLVQTRVEWPFIKLRFESLWWVKIAIFATWSKSHQRIDITAWIKLTWRSATKTRIILRIESVTCMPQFLKLMLYNEVNLSVRFQDYFSHVLGTFKIHNTNCD